MRWLGPALASALLLGCQTTERGRSGLDAELQRLQAERAFAVLEAGEQRTIFAARGQEIAVEPPEGYCLDEDSVSVSRRSAFVLVADCMDGAEATQTAEAEEPPPVFPGILTVTVSGEPALGEEPGTLAAFETLLGTPAGARLLGRGNNGEPGRVVATRRVDRALYVLVEEEAAEGSESILSPRFWRAFTEVHDRLVLVTVSGFHDRPLAEDEMLRFLAGQIAELRRANGIAPGAGENRIVEAVLTEVEANEASAEDGEGSAWAPSAAPRAPRRPG